jgi:hypothetical protein
LFQKNRDGVPIRFETVLAVKKKPLTTILACLVLGSTGVSGFN